MTAPATALCPSGNVGAFMVKQNTLPSKEAGTVSGYFNDLDKAAKEAAQSSGKAPAVYFSLNPVDRRHRCPAWRIRRLFERRLLPPVPRVGAYRMIAVSDLPMVEKALQQVGYLPRDKEVQHVS